MLKKEKLERLNLPRKKRDETREGRRGKERHCFNNSRTEGAKNRYGFDFVFSPSNHESVLSFSCTTVIMFNYLLFITLFHLPTGEPELHAKVETMLFYDGESYRVNQKS